MKERPILFNGDMVRALLDGRKTQTRRIVKAKHLPFIESLLGGFLDGKWNQRPMPYGQPGDQLWVRETWAPGATQTMYRAGCHPAYKPPEGKWRPSIHMPRWASRITLEIVSVRVERLQDISEADAQAEGVEPYNVDGLDAQEIELLDLPLKEATNPNRNAFSLLWHPINGAASWDANPWVWCITFRRIEQ